MLLDICLYLWGMNSIGKLFRLTTFGESHGAAIGGIGTERFKIEEIATKNNIPILALVVKQSIYEAITLMTDDIANQAETVKEVVGDDIKLKMFPTDDNRSYHISSKKIKKILNFDSKFTIKDAIEDLQKAFEKNLLPNSLTDEKYFNIKRMKSINLK